jgi:hypothetical protein
MATAYAPAAAKAAWPKLSRPVYPNWTLIPWAISA